MQVDKDGLLLAATTIFLLLVTLLPLHLAFIHHGLDCIEPLGGFRDLTKLDRARIRRTRKRKTPHPFLTVLDARLLSLIVRGAKRHDHKTTDQHETRVEFGHDCRTRPLSLSLSFNTNG